MKPSLKLLLLFALLMPIIGTCSDDRPMDGGEPTDSITYLVPAIVRTIPHMNYYAREAFTQGLLCHDGLLYESNGTNDKSNIRSIDPADGSIVERVFFPTDPEIMPYCTPYCFGEGITIKDGRIVQLTFLLARTFSWSIPDLDFLGVEYYYNMVGWGITTVDSSFVTTHGSDTLYFRDDSFEVTKKVPVTFRAEPLDSLNEMETVDGTIYANVLGHKLIYGIDPASGVVHTVVNCSALIDSANVNNDQDPLNGIAYDAATGYFYLTGKNWPLIFEVLLEEEE